jgi:CubicO group peptidase (beta-lactamase class C family)
VLQRYVRGYGFTHVEATQRMTACARVSIGSTTKSMTVLASMQRVEQRKVDLDTPVTRYLQTVSGMPYEQYMARHVFRPLGMDHTTFGPPEELGVPVAQGHG